MATTANALQAYVLHQYPWSESSLVLDLFTREQGRLTVIAKGAKRPHSQLRSVLLPFQRVHVSLGRPPKDTAAQSEAGGNDAVNLRSAEWAGGANQAMLTGSALFSGFYMNELLMRLLPRADPHPRLFDAYHLTLPDLLSGREVNVQAALRSFELVLLSDMGWLPDLADHSATMAPLVAKESYSIGPEQGVGEALSGATLPGEALISLQAALMHGTLAPLQHACMPVLQPLKAVLRRLLDYHLGHHPLRTREVLREVQAMQPRTAT